VNAGVVTITSANQLGELLNLVHDRWFDAERVALDKERKTVAIDLEVKKANLAKGSKDGIRLLIKNAEALTINDTEKVRDYDLNEIKFDAAERASYALKLLQSEGELTIASTGKDPATGKMVTQEYHVEGPVMIFLTTTAIDLDEELQNRCLTLAVDESAEQTGRIHRVQRERRTLAGLIARAERKDLLKKLRDAQRLLSPVDVLNPFAPALTFPTGRTRNRRDHEKYLTLIDAIALLHQHQRETRTLPGGQRFIEVTLDDIALANELAPEVLGRSLDELPPQTRRLLAFIRELMKQKRKERGAKAASTFSRKELRDLCGWSLSQVRVHLERLVELEYLAIRHGRLGSAFVYEIIFDLDAPEAVAHIGLIEVESLRTHDYKTNLAVFPVGVADENGRVLAGGKTVPPPLTALAAVT